MSKSNDLEYEIYDLNVLTDEFHFARLVIDSALEKGWFTTPEKDAEKMGVATRAEALAMINEWDGYLDRLSDWLQEVRNARWDYWKRVFYPPEFSSVWEKGAVVVDFRIIKAEFEIAIDKAGDPDGLLKRHRPAYKLSYKTIAEALSISPDSVGHWHSGKALRAGSPRNANRIADFYGVSLTRAMYWNLPGQPLVPVYPDEHQAEIVYPPRRVKED